MPVHDGVAISSPLLLSVTRLPVSETSVAFATRMPSKFALRTEKSETITLEIPILGAADMPLTKMPLASPEASIIEARLEPSRAIGWVMTTSSL